MKTIIEIHVLQNFSPSNLNRDDTGAPKDAIFGGTRRARISSQCQKRSVRQSFLDLVKTNKFSQDEVGVRTKRVINEIAAQLTAMKRDNELAMMKAGQALSMLKLPVKEDGKNEYLLFLGHREISKLAAVINERWDDIIDPNPEQADGKKQTRSKKKGAQEGDPELKKALAAVIDGGKAVDVALFGRMLADMPEKNQEAACQVAHALSTHAVDREFDFYTAVDDLKPDDNAGADMMGTIEFNSACFYRYAVLDWEKLLLNLQDDRVLAVKGLRAFIEGFIVSEPTGKQNSFAAHNPPEFVVVSVRRNTAPRNLANAFEAPVVVRKGESLTRKSAEELTRKAMMLQSAFGGQEQTSVFNVIGAAVDGFGVPSPTLADLLDKTLKAVEG